MFIRDRITTLRVVPLCSYVWCGCVRGWVGAYVRACVRMSERVRECTLYLDIMFSNLWHMLSQLYIIVCLYEKKFCRLHRQNLRSQL